MESILIATDIDVKDSSEAIRFLCSMLAEQNLVDNDYADAVIARESEFPTGLQLEKYGVAIPHADPDKVSKSCFCIGKLSHPVIFKQMGSPDVDILVDVVILMGVKHQEDQVYALQKIVEMISDSSFMEKLMQCRNKEELNSVLIPILGGVITN